MRVEGLNSTIVEQTLQSIPHYVYSTLGGTHICDGTKGGGYNTSVNTALSALDSLTKNDDFSWDGPWVASQSDYLVTRIGADSVAGYNGVLGKFK